MKSYGITEQRKVESQTDYHIENIKIKGFSVAMSVLTHEECDVYANKLEEIYITQEGEFGKDNLARINELDLARMPFLYSKDFFDLFMHPLVIELAQKIIGTHFHLHLQNGIINRPQKEHHQTAWHRDLPYQDWVISKPLGFNAFYCLSDFTTQNGATFVLPYSHRLDYFPSNQFVKENELQLTAPKGSIIFFDSMLYHRAGYNSTTSVRYGVNNMFVVPILKQQLDIPSQINSQVLSEMEREILGITFSTPKDVVSFRKRRLK